MTTKLHPWSWFTDKVLPPVFAFLAIASITAGFATYTAVHSLTSKVENTDKEIILLKSEVKAISANSVTRSEMLDTMKRVELQLELMMARAGIKKNANITQ
jgi:hypothetical protein